MNIAQKSVRFLKFKVVGVLGLALAAFQLSARAADQPKPGPEQKKLEMFVGSWTYEGAAEATPFWPAGKYRGKMTARMVLRGFFLESRAEDKGETGYIYQNVVLRGYDAVTKTYSTRGFENDGSGFSESMTLNGTTWTSTGTKTDNKGKVYRTRNVTTFSPDGRSFTEEGEYSADEGKTWLSSYKDTVKKVGK
ncbi:MAG: DUF1579 domain-containing protein [Acidobacteria bacterium]|nr:DUF1579 domain-containing protein [Acidobacteriota bacterium]